jgi:hypothetical protein
MEAKEEEANQFTRTLFLTTHFAPLPLNISPLFFTHDFLNH